jgi:hypothetical protein
VLRLLALPAAARTQDLGAAVAARSKGDVHWEAGAAYAPFYGGFFPSVLLGSMVAGGWDSPMPSDSGSGGSGGGDFGGGGGGDFGGGGGGDFGGGSF